MPTKKTNDPQGDAAYTSALLTAATADQANELAEQDALFDNWDDDNPQVVDVGGFDSEIHDPVIDGPLVGFRIGTRYEVGPNKTTMYEFDTRDGLRSVWGSTVLDSKLENVPAESLVRIEYLGERRGSSGMDYFDYSVKFKLVPGRVDPAIAAAPATDAPPF